MLGSSNIVSAADGHRYCQWQSGQPAHTDTNKSPRQDDVSGPAFSMRTDKQDGCGDDGNAQGQAPAPGVALGAVVDQLRDQDADGDGQLEQDVERAAQVRWRHLAVVQRRALRAAQASIS